MRPIIALLFVALLATSCGKPEKSADVNAAKQIEGRWFLKNIVVDDPDESKLLTDDWKPVNYEFMASGDVKIYVNEKLVRTNSWSFDAQKSELTFLDLFNTPFISTVVTADGSSLILEGLAVIEGTQRAEQAIFYFTK